MPSGRMNWRSRPPGINTTRYKLMAFCLSGFFAGISGGLYAHYMRIAGPSTLEVSMSFTVVIWAIFGGVATIYGPIAAVFILFPLLEFVRFWPEYRTLIFAVVVLLILLYMPEGLITWVRDKMEKECPRCKIRNVAARKTCRVCTAESWIEKAGFIRSNDLHNYRTMNSNSQRMELYESKESICPNPG